MWIVAVVGFSIVAAGCTEQETAPGLERDPIAVGDVAPTFALRSASDGTVSLSDFAGKPVLLYFSMGPG
jgi:cytochrome oxidase Cu insertion factor (SCO1/SenC/PrrC family)